MYASDETSKQEQHKLFLSLSPSSMNTPTALVQIRQRNDGRGTSHGHGIGKEPVVIADRNTSTVTYDAKRTCQTDRHTRSNTRSSQVCRMSTLPVLRWCSLSQRELLDGLFETTHIVGADSRFLSAQTQLVSRSNARLGRAHVRTIR